MRKRLIESRYQSYGSDIEVPRMTVKAAAFKFGFGLRRAEQILQEYRDGGFKIREPSQPINYGRKSQLTKFKKLILEKLDDWRNKTIAQRVKLI